MDIDNPTMGEMRGLLRKCVSLCTLHANKCFQCGDVLRCERLKKHLKSQLPWACYRNKD